MKIILNGQETEVDEGKLPFEIWKNEIEASGHSFIACNINHEAKSLKHTLKEGDQITLLNRADRDGNAIYIRGILYVMAMAFHRKYPEIRLTVKYQLSGAMLCEGENAEVTEEMLEKVKEVVIIDHHRRSADFIESATLTFQEVYASSAAELVTELLQYVEEEIELKTIEAESLYAGVMMDTKNFTYKTGVRTFEAAAYLRKCGVDIIRVKKWFQSDLESFNRIAEIVGKAEIVNDTIAISTYEEKAKDVNVVCAKAADELLTISEITASFVIGQLDDKVCISGRSIGDINVQIILEKLGGGGHITLAGAQVEDMTIEETKQELINRINEYFAEMEN